MGKFVHLHTHSHYSLLDGLAKIDDLIGRTKELGMDSLAITDHGVLYGAIEFYKKAKKAGIRPILGVEAYMAPKGRADKEPGERYYHLILLCENLTGWKNLIKLVSQANLEGYYYKPRMDKELLREHHEGLIALSACLTGEVNRHLVNDRFDEAKKAALEYEEIFGKGNFFLEIGDHPNIPENVKLRREVLRLAKETGLELVATQDIHYAKKEDAPYHDILVAVQTGAKLTDDDRLTLSADDFSLNSPEEMMEKFKDAPEAIENTIKIAERCQLELELGKVILPNFPKPDGKTANQYLEELISERMGHRFPGEKLNQVVRDRLSMELGVIEKTGFADYFLIVQDFIKWAKDHGIAVGPGRGSAAGSLVSYILGITDLDPIAYGLLFERFLNPDRIQMPDVDVDFADTGRDKVLAYVKEKYGEDHVAQIITFGTMAARAGIRDAGRAMGLSYDLCNKLAKLIPFNMKLKEAIEKVPELNEQYAKNAEAKKLLDAAYHLEGVARHASVHACGTVISKEPLTEYLPIQLAPQDKNNIITQFEMHTVEDLGLLKIDFLGLKNLSIIEETARLVKERTGRDIKINELPLDDQKTFDLLRAGDTTGVFQLEGGGMRRYLKDLEPSSLEDIIAMISLYRPGTLDAGMVPHYIARKLGKEKVTYLHPKLEPILNKTYGIMLYQEQLMEVARALAGFTFSEADTLRKAVGKKIKSLLQEQEEKLVKGMIKNGIDAKLAHEIWLWFEPFARYGFNRSHAACYALIGYQTAYLKAHFPQEFYASLLNSEVNDIDRIAVLITEAKKNRIEVLPPEINKSFVNFSPEEETKIRFGLLAIKNVGEQVTMNMIAERVRGGPFRDITDFLTRIQHKDLNKKSLESLIKAGVLDSLGIERKQLLENLEELLRFNTAIKKSGGQSSNSLFGPSIGSGALLKLRVVESATPEEKLVWEKELLGFYLSDHPLKSYAEKIKATQAKPINEAKLIKSESQVFRIAGMISKIQKVVTKTGQPMAFVKIEDLSPQAMEVIVFNSILTKTQSIWQENKVVLVQGKISLRGGEAKMICDQAKLLEA
ncbi:MAG: DNA polymerase III subunit alpha [Candidatus Liptonbacteria bacterium]|nr:DNA polymerase III subunit alpha [Candidatus Liptonbacteria bacterium]